MNYVSQQLGCIHQTWLGHIVDNLVSEIINVIKNWTIGFEDEIGMTKNIRECVIPCVDLNQPGNMYLGG